MRIYDNPIHPQYGPVRRLWVVLTQLDMLPHAARYDSFSGRNGYRLWDERIAEDVACGLVESDAQRKLVSTLLHYWS